MPSIVTAVNQEYTFHSPGDIQENLVIRLVRTWKSCDEGIYVKSKISPTATRRVIVEDVSQNDGAVLLPLFIDRTDLHVLTLFLNFCL